MRLAIQRLATDMERIMVENKNKGKAGWDYITLGDCLQRLHDELGEVCSIAIFAAENYKNLEGWKELQKEIVDVANFCMMLHNLTRTKIEKLEGERK